MNIKNILTPPVFENDDKTRVAKLLHVCLLSVITFLSIHVFIHLIRQGSQISSVYLIANGTFIVLLIGLIFMMRQGYVRLAGLVLVISAWLNLSCQAWYLGGVRDSSFTAYFLVILATGLLLDTWMGVILTLLSVGFGFILAHAEVIGVLPYDEDTPYIIWFDQSLNFVLAIILLILVTNNINNAFAKLRHNENILATNNRELQAIKATLEQRVTQRTQQLSEQNEQLQQEIEERHRIEESLRQANEELAKLNADKDKFFSIVAHDLRAPFTPVLGASQMLVEMIDHLPPEQIKTIAQGIHYSADNTFRLLENLLEWSRLQMGRMSYNPEVIDLQLMVGHTCSLLQTVADHKGLTLQKQGVAGVMAHADEYMLNTILRNLVNNALKFTPTNGCVSVGYSQVSDAWVEMYVNDTGVGIHQDDVGKLFQLDSNHSTLGTNEEQGTGLGLILCQEMVELHGGTIWVESTVGQGTTVRFTLPTINQAGV